MDVVTAYAAVPIILVGVVWGLLGQFTGLVPCREWLASTEVRVWLEDVGLVLHLALGLLLSVSSGFATSVAISVTVSSVSLALLPLVLHLLLE